MWDLRAYSALLRIKQQPADDFKPLLDQYDFCARSDKNDIAFYQRTRRWAGGRPARRIAAARLKRSWVGLAVRGYLSFGADSLLAANPHRGAVAQA
jgi:hypothetical protein